MARDLESPEQPRPLNIHASSLLHFLMRPSPVSTKQVSVYRLTITRPISRPYPLSSVVYLEIHDGYPDLVSTDLLHTARP